MIPLAGNTGPYVISYLRVQNAMDVHYSDIVWWFALAGVGYGLAILPGGYLEQKIGTRTSVLTGACISM